MRLFQISRRFNVEVQPQLVLLQKTLLNIEGLGRQLDPDLDLWVTAKPFLENWMNEQIGWKGFQSRMTWEATQWATILPAIPRLVHQNLIRNSGQVDRQLEVLVQQQKRLTQAVGVMLLVVLTALGVAVLPLVQQFL